MVDAVDDTSSNRWDSVDTGTTVVTIRVGRHRRVAVRPRRPRATTWSRCRPPARGRPCGRPRSSEYRDAGGAPVTYTFDQPGTYRYECSLHGPMMSGTIIVTDVEGDNTARPPTRSSSRCRDRHRWWCTRPPTPTTPTVTSSRPRGTSAPAPRRPTPTTRCSSTVTPGHTSSGCASATAAAASSAGLRDDRHPASGPTDPEPPTTTRPSGDRRLAAPGQGAAPARVAFSTQVTTTGTLHAYSAGLDDYPDLTGEAVLVRSRGRTRTSLRSPGQAERHPLGRPRPRAGLRGPPRWRPLPLRHRAALRRAQRVGRSSPPRPTGRAGRSRSPRRCAPALRRSPSSCTTPTTPPVASAAPTWRPALADLVYSWSFGDRTTGTGADPDHLRVPRHLHRHGHGHARLRLPRGTSR